MKANSNMLISLPKVGKTTLLIAMTAAWRNGAQRYLGQPLVCTCPRVIVPDMSRIHWMNLVSRFGLAELSSTVKWKLHRPFKSLFSNSEGIQLDDADLTRIADLAEANPGGCSFATATPS